MSSGNTNKIEFITIATKGNATDFGDRTDSRTISMAVSSPTRGVFLLVVIHHTHRTKMDFIEILTRVMQLILVI